MKMHFIYFSIAAIVTLAVTSPVLEDHANLSDDSLIARGLAPAAANERQQADGFGNPTYSYGGGSSDDTISDRRSLSPAEVKEKRQFEWLFDDDDWWDDYFGDFDTWVSETTAKRRDLQSLDAKDKRQLDFYFDDEDSYYDDWVGDFPGGISDNSAKAKS